MRNAIHSQILEAVEAVEESIQPLALRSDRSAVLAAEFKVADAQIAILSKDYMALTCGANDKKAFDVVHTARMDVKDLRVQVDKKRKDLVADSLDWQRTVNAEAKRITALMEPIETHLEGQEAVYTAEQDRIKAERQREAQARVQGRIDALAAVGVRAELAAIALMPDEAFQRYLDLEAQSFAKAEAVKAEEKARVEAEEVERVRLRKVEEERLEGLRQAQAAEAARLAEVKAEQDKQAAALKAERDAMDAEKAKAAQVIRDEQIRKEAQTKAEADAAAKVIADAARVAQEAKAEAERVEAERLKTLALEAARPDADKLLALALETETWAFPEMSSDAGRAAMLLVVDANKRFAAFIRKQAAELTK